MIHQTFPCTLLESKNVLNSAVRLSLAIKLEGNEEELLYV